MRDVFHLFAYGSLRSNGTGSSLLRGCEHIGSGEVGGVLYDIDGEYRALVLYGSTPVPGDVWRCPTSVLATLDEYEGVEHGLFRRIGVNVKLNDGAEVGCWVYVAGPSLSEKLRPGSRQ